MKFSSWLYSEKEEMRNGFYFGLLAIIGIYIYDISAEELSVTLSVPSPPLVDEDTNSFTYVRTRGGNIERIALSDVQNETTIADFVIERDVRFELFTPKNPTQAQVLVLDNYTTVKTSNFNWWAPTRILIHGWYSEGLLTPRFADAYFNKTNSNINFIAVNWQKGSDIYNYLTARGRVNDMGAYVARFVDFMYSNAWLNIESLTIVGHSLGAHIAGIAGKKITKGKVGKIVDLDPASPWFDINDLNGRLAETDASYVETIHTCAGYLGFSQPIGMASFYPNGGTSQPGCGWTDVAGACAHGRAYEYYIESISKPEYYAFECKSFDELKLGNCSVMNHVVQMAGEPGISKAQGIFYLLTNPEPVYSKGKNGILQAIMDANQHPYKKLALAGWLQAKKFVKQIIGVDPSDDVSYSELLKQILKHYLYGDYSPYYGSDSEQ